MFLTAITTCQREHRERYLLGTVDSLKSAGVKNVTVVADGGCGMSCYGHAVRLGIVPTFRTAVYSRLESAEETGHSHVAVFQDDIEVHPGIVDYLKATMPQTGVVSLFISEGRSAPEGWSQLPDDGKYPMHVGGCGFVLDVETAQKLIDDEPFPRVDRLGSQLALWCRRRGIPFWIHSPTLIRHVGEVSCRGTAQTVGDPAQLQATLPYPDNCRVAATVPGD